MIISRLTQVTPEQEEAVLIELLGMIQVESKVVRNWKTYSLKLKFWSARYGRWRELYPAVHCSWKCTCSVSEGPGLTAGECLHQPVQQGLEEEDGGQERSSLLLLILDYLPGSWADERSCDRWCWTDGGASWQAEVSWAAIWVLCQGPQISGTVFSNYILYFCNYLCLGYPWVLCHRGIPGTRAAI